MRRMRRWLPALAILPALLMMGTAPASAHIHVGIGFSFGYPAYYGPWGPGPYGYYGYGPYGYAGWGTTYYSPGPVHVQGPPRDAAPVVFEVNPKKAVVLVDGQEAGKGRDFDSEAYPMWLSKGVHVLELRHKGYKTLLVKLNIRPGKMYRVHYDLKQGEGIDPRSTTAQTTEDT